MARGHHRGPFLTTEEATPTGTDLERVEETTNGLSARRRSDGACRQSRAAADTRPAWRRSRRLDGTLVPCVLNSHDRVGVPVETAPAVGEQGSRGRRPALVPARGRRLG